jgi:hypothetical protein
MTPFEWAMVILGCLGFAVTWTAGVIGLMRAVSDIKEDGTSKVAASNEALRSEFNKDQKSQDHNFGEVALAMRQKIADVEKKVYEVEIWGRDNYAIKDDVKDIREAIKEMANDIKMDFRELNAKIDAKR